MFLPCSNATDRISPCLAHEATLHEQAKTVWSRSTPRLAHRTGERVSMDLRIPQSDVWLGRDSPGRKERASITPLPEPTISLAIQDPPDVFQGLQASNAIPAEHPLATEDPGQFLDPLVLVDPTFYMPPVFRMTNGLSAPPPVDGNVPTLSLGVVGTPLPVVSVSPNRDALPVSTGEEVVCSRLSDGTWICTRPPCVSRRFTRYQELSRHQNSVHVRAQTFLCRTPGCNRARRGYSRKDKRDGHEKRVHGAKQG